MCRILAAAVGLVSAAVAAEACASAGDSCSLWQPCCDGSECKQQGFLSWKCIEQCVAEGQTCGGPGLPDSTCCDGLQCEQHLLGTSNKQCVKPQPQCVAEGQTCGGPGLQDSTCCDGLQCEQHLLGTSNKQCVKPEPQCLERGEICGCTGCLTQTCCDGFQCSEVSGQGGKMYCVNLQSFAQEVLAESETQCAAEGQTCGGPGLPDSTCCDGLQCEQHLLGTSNKQCVKPEPQCLERGEICGCTGCLTQTCCDGFQCSEVSGQGGKMYCVDLQSFAQEAVAMEANTTAAP